MKKLTPTSYALLGLLAIRPWSAYELTRHMKRSNVRLIWPRAESKLYEEPKNLAAHGLASAKTEANGGRSRTVYSITRRGRRVLKQWLKEPGAGLLLEFEAMIKVVYGNLGSKEELLENIRRIRHGVAGRSRQAAGLASEVAGEPRFPDRTHVNALVNRFVIEMMQATLRWSEWAEATVEAWSSTDIDDAIAAQARRLHRQNAEAVEAMAAASTDETDETVPGTISEKGV